MNGSEKRTEIEIFPDLKPTRKLRRKELELNLSFEFKWSNLQILTLLQDLCSKRNILMSGQSRSAEIYYAVPKSQKLYFTENVFLNFFKTTFLMKRKGKK